MRTAQETFRGGRASPSAGILPFAFFILHFALPSCAVAAAPWRTYEVYQPTVTRHDVIAAAEHPHKYNHCATIAWFQDRWFCLWGSNSHPDEHAPGQRIYVSTSPDGRRWSPIVQPFSDPEHAENPVAYPPGKGHQWQPNFGLVDGELWAIWNQGGSARDFGKSPDASEDLRGLYSSRLKSSTGRWINRRLLWDGQAQPLIGGEPYQIASTQDLCRLQSGRIVAPVTLYGAGRRAADAPPQATGWWATVKYNAVIYSDDRGATWRLSGTATTPGLSWIQWEPTVWQRPDGPLMMFSRHNTQREQDHSRPTSAEYLLWSSSVDNGQTWSPQRYVPVESVCSRMHVAPLDGRGVWEPPQGHERDLNRRYVMVHNDAPGAVFNWALARRNLTLFFNRGGGIDFTAGASITDCEPDGAYPQMWRHDDTLAVCYTQGNSSPRSIRVALVSPLPKPDRYYIFPRSNELAPSERPQRAGKHLAFQGGQHLSTHGPIVPGAHGFAIGIWLDSVRSGVLLDARGDAGPSRGFSLALGANPKGERQALYPQLSVPATPQLAIGQQALPRDAQWHYLGLSVNLRTNQAQFYVDGQVSSAPLPKLTAEGLRSMGANIGDKRLAKSQLRGFEGRIRSLAFYGEPLDRGQHAWLYNRLAADLGRPVLADAAAPATTPSVLLDAADQASSTRDFTWPPATTRGGSEVASVDGQRVLRLHDQASAGLDLDHNRRERGDRVRAEFRFRLEKGDGLTLCTVGDFNQPARLVAREGQVFLRSGKTEHCCGRITPSGWNTVSLETWGDRTQARLGEQAPVEVRHTPVATWVYLGEAFPEYGRYPGTSLLVDVGSLRTQVDRHDR